MNPPNCPEFRPNEKYWAIVNNLLKKDGIACSYVKGLLKKSNFFAGKVSEKFVQNLMASVSKHARSFFQPPNKIT